MFQYMSNDFTGQQQLILSNPPKISLRMSSAIAVSLSAYLYQCATEGFSGVYDFSENNPVREAMHKHNVIEVYLMLIKALVRYLEKQNGRPITLTLNHSHRITFSHMIRRVEVPAALSDLEFKIINKLIY